MPKRLVLPEHWLDHDLALRVEAASPFGGENLVHGVLHAHVLPDAVHTSPSI
jgi:hypothetical protein